MTGKALKVVLILSMLFSSVGVSVASIACRQKQKMTSVTCTKCKSTKPTGKSCCQTVYKHLGVKSEYHRPVTIDVDAQSLLVLAILTENFTGGASETIFCRPLTTSPPTALGSLDRCSLISTFRI